MKSVVLFFAMMMAVVSSVNAQYGDDNISGGSIRAGVGYVHDFPGLHGQAVYLQYNFSLNSWLQGSIGGKHVQTAGYPRTNTVQEYTKANAIDFELMAVPFQNETSAFKVGLGHTFSFYNIRRSYPVYTAHDGAASTVVYPSSDAKGRVHGTSISAEYEYYFGERFSGGLKVTACKAYDMIIMAGPYVAIRL